MQVAVTESYYDVPKRAMSAEIENNKEEDGSNGAGGANDKDRPPKKPFYKKLLRHWQLAFKLVELLFSAISIGFLYEPVRVTSLGQTHLHHMAFVYGTQIGYMIIDSVAVLSHAIRDRWPLRTSIAFTSLASILFAIAGILLLTDKRELVRHSFFYPHMHLMEMLIVSATLSLLNGLLYLIDTLLTYKYAPDVE